MKLKNSYILLIAMSLFLLVSIGSVCASDSAMDADILANESDVSAEPVVNTTPVKTSVESQDVKVDHNDPQNIPVTVKDNESQSINISKGDLNVTENKKAIKFSYANSSITLTDKLAAGNHSILISYLGNANYSSSSKTIKLSVIGDKALDIASPITVNSTKKVIVPVTLTDNVNVYEIDKNNFSLLVSYKEGNDTVNKTVNDFEFVNGTLKFMYDVNVSTCNLTVSYGEGNKTISKNTVLKRVSVAKIIPLNLNAEYASGSFTFKLVDMDTNETLSGKKLSYTIITGNINTGGSATTDKNGIATIDNSNLEIYNFKNGTLSTAGHINVGSQPFSIRGDDSTISAAEIKNNFTVTQATINIKINPYSEYYGSSKKVIINVTNAKTSEPMKKVILHLYMANTTQKDYYFQTDANGTAQINVSGLVSGKYGLTVSNNDTKNIKEKKVDGTITIKGIAVKMKVTLPKTYYYNSGNLAKIKITNKKTGKAVPNAIVLIQIYTGKKYQAYLYQADKKGIVNVNYAPSAVGSHKIKVSIADSRYTGSSVTKSFKTKKATAKLTAAKVTAYHKDGKTFVIKLTNSKNKKAIYAAKVNLKIFISKNRYYNYDGTTGLDGKLRINLDSFKPGTYKVIVSRGESKNYTAKQITSKFVVKKTTAKITPAKLTVKENATKKTFKITVKNTKTKKGVQSLKVKVKITGKSFSKTYTATTNSKGVAQLNLKSLTAGTYKAVVTSTDKYASAKSASATIKITK